MNETLTKRFLLYFRLMLLAWILIVNGVCILLMKPAKALAVRSLGETAK